MTGYSARFEPAMRLALAQAVGSADPDEVPVGAVILDEAGTVIAPGRNRRERDHDPTAHAEIVAIRQAARSLGSWRLTGLTLVVTLEPCTMCAERSRRPASAGASTGRPTPGRVRWDRSGTCSGTLG